MSREHTYLSIILKKQAYGEADELISVFTKESGKLRVLAKSIKSSKSKLQHGLQVLFCSKLTLTSSALPKVIGAEVLETFYNIRESLEGSKIAFYSLELLLKFTADEHKNESLFNLYLDFFKFLDGAAKHPQKLLFGLLKFKISFLENLGFGIQANMPPGFSGPILFSNSLGGFVFGKNASDGQIISSEIFEQFVKAGSSDLSRLSDGADVPAGDIERLQQILARFIQYQLEREIKSEKFLNSNHDASMV